MLIINEIIYNILLNNLLQEIYKMKSQIQTLPYGLPPTPHTSSLILCELLCIPYLTLNEVQYSIRQAFADCEGITSFEWLPENSHYIITYGTEPLEQTVSFELLHIIRIKKTCAFLVANIAYKKYYQYQNNIHNIYDLSKLGLPVMKRQWSKSILTIYWCQHKKCIEIEFRRLSGDRVSSNDLRFILKAHFVKIEKMQNYLKVALEESGEDGENTDLRDYLVCDVI